MSLGETTPNHLARFTSPNPVNTYTNKKFTGPTKAPVVNSSNSGNRNSQARQRLLSSKISAPRPINLPSLRRENASGAEIASSPGSSLGWGSASGSPSFTRSENKTTNLVESSTPELTDPSSLPPTPLPLSNTNTPRAWASPSVTQSKLKSATKETESVIKQEKTPEQAPLENKNDFARFTTFDSNHLSWDEMVSEDLDDFSVNVIEFDDGTKVQLDVDPIEEEHTTETWDKKPHQQPDTASSQHNSHQYRRSSDSHENNEYKPLASGSEKNSVAQNDSNSTAVERAKKRREEQEAEYKAAAERAKQKAATLAAEAQKLRVIDKENTSHVDKKPVTYEDVDKSLTNQNACNTDNGKNIEEQVEILDFSQNEEWGTIPDHVLNGRTHERGWVRNDEHSSVRSVRGRGGISASSRGRGRGGNRRNSVRSTEYGRHSEPCEEPVVIEILKHTKDEPKEKVVVLSYRDKISNLLKNSASPLLPEFIGKSLGEKPANLSFMVSAGKSDVEITVERTEEVVVEDEEPEVVVSVPSQIDESATSSAASTPSQTYYNQQQGEIGNYPLLVYQYPIAQPSTSEETRHSGYPPQVRPMGVYFMPQQQYVANNQYMAPYPQAGSGNVYYPTVPWQQQPQYNNQYSPRPHYKPRRTFTKYNNNNSEWQSYQYNNPRNNYRPNRGRGGFNSYKRYYPNQDYQNQETSFDTSSTAEVAPSSEGNGVASQ